MDLSVLGRNASVRTIIGNKRFIFCERFKKNGPFNFAVFRLAAAESEQLGHWVSKLLIV